MDDPIGWVPDPPHLHVMVTVRTAQGVAPGALLIALAVGQRSDDFDRTLDETSDLGQGLLNQMLDRGKRLGGLHPVIANPLEALREDMLHHTPNKSVDLHRFVLDPLAFVGAVVIGDVVPVIAVDTP